jgi:hypothetical protein
VECYFNLSPIEGKHTLYGQNAELLRAEAIGMCTNHEALKGYMLLGYTIHGILRTLKGDKSIKRFLNIREGEALMTVMT